MGEIISIGVVVLAVVALFYFVIKTAVKNGINQSMLFSEQLREAQRKREAEQKNKSAQSFDKEI